MPIALVIALLAVPPPGEFSITLTENVLAGLLTAASPIEHTFEQDTGIAGRVQLVVTLSDPQVRVTNAAIKISMNYHVRNSTGLIDARGIAKPDLIIVARPSKGDFEARFTHLVVTLPGGVDLPLDGIVKPIAVPGVINEDVSLGSKVVTAQGRGTSVLLETGKVHLRGTMTFSPKLPTAKQAGR